MQILDDQEIPWLREPDARRMVSGYQHARQNLIGNWIGKKLTDIAAPKNRFIKASAQLHRQAIRFICHINLVCAPARNCRTDERF